MGKHEGTWDKTRSLEKLSGRSQTDTGRCLTWQVGIAQEQLYGATAEWSVNGSSDHVARSFAMT